jgi:xylan 1,4-beta-xylosidase
MTPAGKPFQIAAVAAFSLVSSLLVLSSPGVAAPKADRPTTYMNPLDLPYRFTNESSWAGGKSAREAADPMVVVHNGEYWLFASKSGGYWHSKDLIKWDLIEPVGFPVEDYAPTVKVIGDKWVLFTSGGQAVYVSDDAASGQWRKVRSFDVANDPDLFVDDNGKLYLYWGSSPDQPIYGQELDPVTFLPIGEKRVLIEKLLPLVHGWEARGQADSDDQIRAEPRPPWMEGATMTKFEGRYYLQYAAPATEMKGYADGVYVSEAPLGPYVYAPYNPVSYKPTGFATSAGHSVTFKGPRGSYWRAVSMLIGVNFMFERRLGLFPAGFLKSKGEVPQFATNTYLGDYPQLAPGVAKDPLQDNLAGWMLLSYAKTSAASSTLDGFSPDKAFDEDIQTWWAAKTGNPGEWLSVDLGKPSRIEAVQINFADARSTQSGRLRDAYKYLVEVSDDGQSWRTLIDKRDNMRDAPHEYIQLNAPVTARFARITNTHSPAGAVFSISGLRFFGNGLGQAPKQVTGVEGRRLDNHRLMTLSWKKTAAADFYVVRYGVRPDRLTLNYQVYNATTVTIPGLNTDQEYYFAVDAVNDSGLSKGKVSYHAK